MILLENFLRLESARGRRYLYSPRCRDNLSDKSKQALFWSPTSGYYGAKKPYLAVTSATKTAVEKPTSYLSDSFSQTV